MNTAYKPDKNAALKEVTHMLEEGVKSVFTSERYIKYLETLSKFHKYSFSNVMLIMQQNPYATRIAGFNDWKNKHNRNVKYGEKGIKIIAPNPYKTKVTVPVLDSNNQPIVVNGVPLTEEKTVQRMSFRVVSVFDVSQTDGEPLPTLAPELTADVASYEELFNAICATTDFTVKFDDIPGGAKGTCNYLDKTITIQQGMSQAQTIKTALHEVAHSRLHSSTLENKDRKTREVEAESVAFVVANKLCIDTSDYSFDYVANWSTNKELAEFKKSLEVIQKEACAMIDIIEAKYGELLRSKETIREESVFSNLVSSHEEYIANTPNERNTVVINAFAGPGAGKTTSCLEVCAELKKAGYVAEYVQEYAKELVWEGRTDMLSGSTEGQLHILQEQLSRMDRLYGKVDFIVTDCPVFLPAIYLKEPSSEFEVASKEIFEHFRNFNYFVERDVSSFETKGRIHNLEESLQIDETLKTTLNSLGLQYGTYNHSTIQNIVKDSIAFRDNFIFNQSKVTPSATIPVPDESITISDMHNYGYVSDVMYPVDSAIASKFLEYLPEIPMYKLYPDNTEALLNPEENIQDDLLYGIEKADWERAYSQYFESPRIKVMWSEHLHPKLKDNTILTIKEADAVFESCDLAAKASYPNGGYDKTKFAVFFTANNEIHFYTGRQDFGDGDGSLTEHISEFNENLSLLLKHHCLVDVLESYLVDKTIIHNIRERLNALDLSDNDIFIERLSEISNDINVKVQKITHRDITEVTKPIAEHTSPSEDKLSDRTFEQNNDIVSKVREISIVDYASRMGFTVQRVGSYYTLKEHDSVRIDPRTNRFFRNSTGERGSIIDFVMEFENVNNTQAISQLARYLGSDRPTPARTVSSKPREKKTRLELPQKSKSMKNIFAYLIQTRKISPEIVNEWVAKKNLYQDTHNNCVFVTFDSKGRPAFASQRGTNTSKPFKADVPGSNYDICHFINNGASTLIIGEAAIDIMSVQTIMKAHGRDLSKYNYLSLNGSTKIRAVINALQSSKTDTVILATDNDTAGKIARDSLRDLISEYSPDIKVEDYVPTHEKDWNAELVATVLSEEHKEEPSQQKLSDKLHSIHEDSQLHSSERSHSLNRPKNKDVDVSDT